MNRFFSFLIKIDRLSAWVLFLTMLFYFISGYGMTKGIISGSFATKLHLDILPIIIILAFTFHTSFAIHLAFKRWRFWNSFSKILLFVFYAAFLIFFGSIEIFYPGKFKTTNPQNTTPTTTPAARGEDNEEGANISPTPSQNQANPSRVFTTAELAKFNGQNGQLAYLAVDGVVYDLSAIFVGGSHFQHFAGHDLSAAFKTQHVLSQIKKYPVVGKLQ